MLAKSIRSGFTVIELLVVIAVIAIVAAIAIPNLKRAKLTANEASAVVTLRAIAQAQAQVTSSPAIDSDGDGQGEYGYFAELAGYSVTRIDAGGTPGVGGPNSKLVPNALLAALGNVQGGVVTYSGYVFAVWLPDATAGGFVPGIREDPTGGKLGPPFPDPNNCESLWCAYGWPVTRNGTGTPCYFVNNQGQILAYDNRGATTYSGIAGGPNFDAALTVAGHMGSAIAIGPALTGADGNQWVVLR
jgi:prepilin-type N-terminal cleavage/methylation domain-containing protein